ncbi:MAG: hypothetical protein SNJ55_06430 [Chloroherpetonaceae bacterium]
MKHITLFIVLLSISGCDLLDPSQRPRRFTLDKNYDMLIVGVISPRENYVSEVFVGRATPSRNPVMPRIFPSGVNRDVFVSLLGIRQNYAAEINPHLDARVFISDEFGNRVELTNSGEGYYRDANRTLAIEPEKTYHLEVEHRGRTFRGKTFVPGRFEIFPVSNGDTVRAPFYRSLPPELSFRSGDTFFPSFGVVLQWTKSTGAGFYGREIHRVNSDTLIGFSFFRAGVTIFNFRPDSIVKATNRILAIDSSWMPLYYPDTPNFVGGSLSENPSWTIYSIDNEFKPLSSRSSIQGPGNNGGFFGSFIQNSVTFWATPGDTFIATTRSLVSQTTTSIQK